MIIPTESWAAVPSCAPVLLLPSCCSHDNSWDTHHTNKRNAATVGLLVSRRRSWQQSNCEMSVPSGPGHAVTSLEPLSLCNNLKHHHDSFTLVARNSTYIYNKARGQRVWYGKGLIHSDTFKGGWQAEKKGAQEWLMETKANMRYL